MRNYFLRVVALTAAISLGFAGAGFAAGGSIGYGDIVVYKSGKLTAKLSGQNPIENGSLMICDGKCMIKSEGISLIGEDSAQIAVMSEDDIFKLYVKEGKVSYVINSNIRKISFYTPDGTYTVAEVVFNAGSQTVVKGTVVVSKDGKTEISVTEGRLVFATADGMKTVDANHKIVLAVLPGTVQAAAPAGEGISTTAWVAGGVGLAAAVVVTALVIDNNNDDNNSVSSGGASIASPSN